MRTLSSVECGYLMTPFGPQINDILPNARFNRVLDLGCGDGANTYRLRHVAPEVWGVDSDPALIRSAHSTYPGIHFIAETAENYLRSTPLTYDCVTCSRLLGFIPDLHALFAPLRRCTTGYLVLCDWHPLACWVTPGGFIGKDYSVQGCFSPGQYHHSIGAITNALVDSGFEVCKILEGPLRSADPYYAGARPEVQGLPLAMCWVCTA